MEREINIKLMEKFKVYFHGKFIPLQGVQYIVEAAKILDKHEDIEFNIIGKGQTYREVTELARKININNVNFIDRVPYHDLPKMLLEADICLGVFGDTAKTKRVIPNKIYESIALAKPVITADTVAIRELFEDRENILLCRVSDAEDLANKVLELKENSDLRGKIEDNGYKLFKEKCSPQKIVKQLIINLKS